ncbi:carbohydrate ABC transporter permease [Sinomonas sp. JGH33]|uniref:Carbohydrate ABC transporter permease n=1 Tax=Sinomonas terricola TaxID=3110330 RepID=A0ABU5TBL4_9MICC|nr:carbohydrate ABC transporter permease [Sinomonas sp. JGH33]MEA5457084.1 carbohydrate ABC transporter permease [Sinomonas sp. JGH33]
MSAPSSLRPSTGVRSLPSTGPGTTSRSPHRTKATARILTPAALAVASLYFLFPLYWLLIASTKDTGDLFGSSGLSLQNPQLLENLGRVLTRDGGIYLRWALNSLLYSGVGALGATLMSIAAGYCLAKFAFRGREMVFNIVLAGVMIPGTALALPLFLFMSQLGLVNTLWAVLIPSLVSPFGVYLGRIYATAAVPDTLLEAARLDGAGEFRIFAGLVLRLMAPAAVTVFLFQFVGIWNNYFLPLVMLSDQNLYPITLGLVSWQSVADRHPELYQLTVGGALLSVVPIMIAIVSLQRFWRAGLTEGSVKG